MNDNDNINIQSIQKSLYYYLWNYLDKSSILSKDHLSIFINKNINWKKCDVGIMQS